ncbi:7-deoxyloganetin glucosyltransferase [Cucumis sativus]|uniref:Glycosyltransferase n=1 Tax=Cucumis sativus TaxID=3659 RepID=A0A0A0LY25_CUCSA|nr:7-deoxyloganetin glucosyltransferase [Cucumis sativus]
MSKRVEGHAVCIPVPVQSHVNAMLSVAKLLHQRGFFITFVITEYTHKRIISSRGPSSLDGLLNFQFKTIWDYCVEPIDAPQNFPSLCDSISNDFLSPFCDLLSQLKNNHEIPPVTCIIPDAFMSFCIQAGLEFNIPTSQFWPISACSILGIYHFEELVKRGAVPFKDESYFSNGYMETTIDWIPGMKNVKMKDLPSFIRTTDPNDTLLNFCIQQLKWAPKASCIVLNTFEALDHDVLEALSHLFPPIYTIGPIHLFSKQIKDKTQEMIATNHWEEQQECISWLDSQQPDTVIYINFGSLAILTLDQLTELAWGIANSEQPFLWILRPDVLEGKSPKLPHNFVEETKGRGMIGSWCSQVEVLNHPSIKGFLTHSGWNSTIESISAGVPMISWPFFGDQQTTCHYCCVHWGIALEIQNNVKRDEVESCIKELIEGNNGKEMKAKVMELRRKAEESYTPGGSSYLNFDRLITQLLLQN